MSGSMPTVLPDKLCRGPDKITQVRHRFDKNLPDPTKRDPVIPAFKNYLQDWAESFIGIGDPFERFSVYLAGARRGCFKGLIAQFRASPELSFAEKRHRLGQESHPFRRLSKDDWRSLSIKNFTADCLADEDRF